MSSYTTNYDNTPWIGEDIRKITSNNNVFTGSNTFTISPQVPTIPSGQSGAVNKEYVDGLLFTGPTGPTGPTGESGNVILPLNNTFTGTNTFGVTAVFNGPAYFSTVCLKRQ